MSNKNVSSKGNHDNDFVTRDHYGERQTKLKQQFFDFLHNKFETSKYTKSVEVLLDHISRENGKQHPDAEPKTIRLWIENGKQVSDPSFSDILEEIETAFMDPVRSAQYLLDYGDASGKQVALSDSILNVTLLRWKKFVSDVSGFFEDRCRKQPKVKPEKSLFKYTEDPRFSEYVAQVQLDGGDISDILESWLKEHNPDFLKDT